MIGTSVLIRMPGFVLILNTSIFSLEKKDSKEINFIVWLEKKDSKEIEYSFVLTGTNTLWILDKHKHTNTMLKMKATSESLESQRPTRLLVSSCLFGLVVQWTFEVRILSITSKSVHRCTERRIQAIQFHSSNRQQDMRLINMQTHILLPNCSRMNE
jgi:hypothetical protein